MRASWRNGLIPGLEQENNKISLKYHMPEIRPESKKCSQSAENMSKDTVISLYGLSLAKCGLT